MYVQGIDRHPINELDADGGRDQASKLSCMVHLFDNFSTSLAMVGDMQM